MNYRHAYHAGNFGDVVKHLILCRVLTYLKRKDAPFFVLDTHAGTGRYDLTATEPLKTQEFKDGIERFMAAIPDAPSDVAQLCAPLTELLGRLNTDGLKTYPGSPLVSQSLIRRSDRLSLVELHPDEFTALSEGFNWAKNTKTHQMDAWAAMKAQLPPKENRGLVLIDPPFEDRDEFNAILRALYEAHKRFAQGTYMIWYPIKDMPMIASFREVLSGMELGKTLDVRLMRKSAGATPEFVGTGMVIINPPYVLEQELEILLPWLTALFESAPGAGQFQIAELAGEK